MDTGWEGLATGENATVGVLARGQPEPAMNLAQGEGSGLSRVDLGDQADLNFLSVGHSVRFGFGATTQVRPPLLRSFGTRLGQNQGSRRLLGTHLHLKGIEK